MKGIFFLGGGSVRDLPSSADPGIVKRAFLDEGYFLSWWGQRSRPALFRMACGWPSADMMDLHF